MRLRTAIRFASFVSAALVALSAASLADGAVTIGGDLTTDAPRGVVQCLSTPCTVSQRAVPTSSQAPGGLTAPTDGVVVRWRLDVGSLTTPTTLRILREGPKPFDDFFAVGTGQPTVIPTANQLSTFEMRLPIQAGDRLGIDCCAAAYLDAFALTTDAPLYYWSPALLDGATPSVANGEYTEHEVLLNADIEPDVDADGFGDETQDQCPSDPSTQVACPPGADDDAPETEITKAPRGSRDRRRRSSSSRPTIPPPRSSAR